MTSMQRPNFIDSPYFVGDPGNWHLKTGAPPEVRREFNRFMKALRQTKAPAVEPRLIDPEDLRK